METVLSRVTFESPTMTPLTITQIKKIRTLIDTAVEENKPHVIKVVHDSRQNLPSTSVGRHCGTGVL